MAKTKELLPPNLQNDQNIQALCEAIDQALSFENELDILLVYLIGNVPSDVLPLLAWQFHVDFWKPDFPLETKKTLIKNSIKWHRYKGTPWAIKKALEWFAVEAEIIEYWQARKKYEELGGARLDGSWCLDGTKKLVSYYNVTGLSYMSKWAKFCIRLNLASMERPDWSKLVKEIVDIAKNTRSWPVYIYFLGLEIEDIPIPAYFLSLKKQISQIYPWCTKRLDGSWSLGTGGELYSLDGSLKVDGSWKVGGETPIYADVALKQCNIFCRTHVLKKVPIGEKWFTLKLGSKRLHLDGGWKLGENGILILLSKKITKSFPIYARPLPKATNRQKVEIDYPASPEKLGQYPALDGRRIDGGWKVGREMFGRKVDGTWKVRKKRGVIAESDLKLNLFVHFGLPTKLGAYPKLGSRWAYKVNGSWQLGAFKKLDGSWILNSQAILGARKVGWHYTKLDGTWGVGDVSRKIDGTWVVGHNGPGLEVKFARRAA